MKVEPKLLNTLFKRKNLNLPISTNKYSFLKFFSFKNNLITALVLLCLISNLSYAEIYITGSASTTSASVTTDSPLATIEGDHDNKLKINDGINLSDLRIGSTEASTNVIRLDNFGNIGIDFSSGLHNGSNSYSASIETINNYSGAKITQLVNNYSSSIGTINSIQNAEIGDIENVISSSIGTIFNGTSSSIRTIDNNSSSHIGTLNNSGKIGVDNDNARGINNGWNSNNDTSGRIDNINNNYGGVITNIKNTDFSSIGSLDNYSGAQITKIYNFDSGSILELNNSGKIEQIYNGFGSTSDKGLIGTINNTSGGVITNIDNDYLSSIDAINNYSNAQIIEIENKNKSIIGTINNIDSSTIDLIKNYSGSQITAIQNLSNSKIGLLENLGTIASIVSSAIKTEGELTLINSGTISTGVETNGAAIDSSGKLDFTQTGGMVKGNIKLSGDKANKIKIIGGILDGKIINSGTGVNDFTFTHVNISTLDNISGAKITTLNNNAGGSITNLNNSLDSTIKELFNTGSIGTINNSSNAVIEHLNNSVEAFIYSLNNNSSIFNTNGVAINNEGTISELINSGAAAIISSDTSTVIRTSGILTMINSGTISTGVATDGVAIDSAGKLDFTQTAGNIKGDIKLSGDKDNRIKITGGILDGEIKNSGTGKNYFLFADVNISILDNISDGKIQTLTNDAGASITNLNNNNSDIWHLNNNSGAMIETINNNNAYISYIENRGNITEIKNTLSSTIWDVSNKFGGIIKVINNNNSKISHLFNYTSSKINEINNSSGATITWFKNNSTIHKANGSSITNSGEIKSLKNHSEISSNTSSAITNLGTIEILINSGSGATISSNTSTAINTSGTLTMINSGTISTGVATKGVAIDSSGKLDLTQTAGNIKGDLNIYGDKDNRIKILGGEVIGDITFNSIGNNYYEQANSTVDGDISLVAGSNATNVSSLTKATINGKFDFNGTLNVAGRSDITDFVLGENSTISLGTLPENGDAYIKASNVTIGDGTKIIVKKPSDFTYNEAFNVIKGTSTLHVQLDKLISSSAFSFYTISKATGTQFLTITKIKKDEITIPGSDENLDELIDASKDQLQNNPDLADGLAELPNDAQAEALTTLLPTTSITSVKGAINAARNATKSINKHMSMHINKAYNNTGISTGELSPNATIWTQVFASNTQQKDIGLIEGYSLNNYGFTLGIERNYLNENNLLGAAFSYSDTSVQISDLGNSKTDLSSFQLAFYYSHYLAKSSSNLFKNIYFNLGASYSLNKNKYSREVVVGSFKNKAEADFNSHVLGFYSELGFKKELNKSWNISPSISLNYAYLNTPTYNETGAGDLELRVSPKSANSLILGVGIKMQKKLLLFEPKNNKREKKRNKKKNKDISDFIFEIRGKVTQELLDNYFVTTSNFEGSAQFITKGVTSARMGIEVGIGIISINATKNLELRADYNFKYKESNKTSNIYLTAKYNF